MLVDTINLRMVFAALVSNRAFLGSIIGSVNKRLYCPFAPLAPIFDLGADRESCYLILCPLS